MASTPGYTVHGNADSPESKLIGCPLAQNPEKAAIASPITYVNAGDPPFLIVHGEKDPVVPPDQGKQLHSALQKAGVASQFIIIPDARHGGPEFNSAEIQTTVADFFKRNLNPQKD